MGRKKDRTYELGPQGQSGRTCAAESRVEQNSQRRKGRGKAEREWEKQNEMRTERAANRAIAGRTERYELEGFR